MFQKDLSLCMLFDRYALLLSEKQKSVFELSYFEDLSLSEIAEHTHTSRQAVRELLSHTQNELRRFETALHLCEKQTRIEALCGEGTRNNPEFAELFTRILDTVKE